MVRFGQYLVRTMYLFSYNPIALCLDRRDLGEKTLLCHGSEKFGTVFCFGTCCLDVSLRSRGLTNHESIMNKYIKSM